LKVLNPTDIGDQNKLSILQIIKENDGISRQEISKRLKLSAPAVSKNIAALLETGIIWEAGIDETSMGRKPIQLKYNASIMYVMGIEMMPNEIRGAIADLYGNTIAWETKPLSLENGVTAVLNQLDEVIDKLILQKAEGSKLAAIVIGVPALTGQEDLNDLFITYLPEWKDIDLKHYVEERYQVKTEIMNDVELALMGECAEGEGRVSDNILFIKYGEGFAARAVIDGNLLKGYNMAAGEIGYYLEDISKLTGDFVCPGRIEQELCKAAIRKKEYEGYSGIEYLQKQSGQGNTESEQALERIINRIAVIIANTVLVLNPEIVILGGIASKFNEDTILKIESVLRRTCPFVPKIAVSQLGIDAPVIGGIKIALESAEKQLITYWK